MFFGSVYNLRVGVSKDYAEAAKWYRKAADQGHAGGQLNLGVLYADSDGVPQDYTMSIAWFNIAATCGDKDAVDARAEALKIMTPQQLAEGQDLAREPMKTI